MMFAGGSEHGQGLRMTIKEGKREILHPRRVKQALGRGKGVGSFTETGLDFGQLHSNSWGKTSEYRRL